MRSIDAATALCAVIGHPIGHTLSPALHNAAFSACALNYVYLAFPVEDPGAFLAGMRAMPNFRGLSVTIPHKLAVIPHLDRIEVLAEKVGSVNTVTNEHGALVGSTTDGPGALRALKEAGVALEGKRLLFLGAGGAVRAVAFAAAQAPGVRSITVLGRTAARVNTLVEDLQAHSKVSIAGGDLASEVVQAAATHEVLIQGTPMGMAPDSEGKTWVPASALRPGHAVFDMVYRPAKTRLVADALEAGATVVYGIEMLLHQAALQFEGWTGQSAPLDAMRKAAQEGLREG